MEAVAGGSLPGPAARLALAMKSWTCAGLLAAVGCGHGGGDATQCNLAAEPAVVVTLVGPSSGATLVLIDGSYQETMVEVEPGAFRGGFERAGTYRVEASAPGFVSQAVDGVVAFELRGEGPFVQGDDAGDGQLPVFRRLQHHHRHQRLF